MNINKWLSTATNALRDAGITSAQLDSELILTHTIRKPRTYLHAHPELELDSRIIEIANARLDLRLDRVPLAYIIGHKEFYGRQFDVTSATLIPRPESEALIEVFKDTTSPEQTLDPSFALQVADVGTGSGILGITAKLERPQSKVALLDISRPALNIAEKNARKLGAEVQLLKSDLLSDYPYKADVILANLPYVDKNWDLPPELGHEPEVALYAKHNGLQLINRLLTSAPARLAKNGIVILEADRRQHGDIIKFAESAGYEKRAQKGLALAFTYLG